MPGFRVQGTYTWNCRGNFNYNRIWQYIASSGTYTCTFEETWTKSILYEWRHCAHGECWFILYWLPASHMDYVGPQ